jgi:hypothetical protein
MWPDIIRRDEIKGRSLKRGIDVRHAELESKGDGQKG